MPDDTILVTDVRLKRTVRDYARDYLNRTLFVDYDEKGNAITADDSARRIIHNLEDKDVIKELIMKTFDVPLFGALVTVRPKQGGAERQGEGGSFKLTGPVQFGIARSVNKVRVINPSITSHFLGREKPKKPKAEEAEEKDSAEEQRHGTIGKFYAVEYALIKAYGAVTPKNLGKYYNDPEVVKRFNDVEGQFFHCLWNGTNHLVSRSKYPQRSLFFIEISYKTKLYNDLHLLVDETEEMKGWAKSLSPAPFAFSGLVDCLKGRNDDIERVRIAHCEDLYNNSHELLKELESKGLKPEDVSCK